MKTVLLLSLMLLGCNESKTIEKLQQDNNLLIKKVDSLTKELNKCDMMLESYEGMPLGV